ncbi:Gly-Xaa carboxypeptidase [Malassezia nana]|uniref:Gly-Xaa carboxypeptidase n=1 Tax=Malassezia nana TaxID=180528 RepID=A0AAF0ELA3_9BASI|nr:Gly-Xaa carboxypeptidase [Malassezia nana]
MHPMHFDYDALFSDGEQGVCPQAPAISLNEMLDDLNLSFPSARQSAERLSRSDPSLKPLLLMAHQDVVPVENSTWNEWAFPPFSGHIDLEHQGIWGRGAVDCKQFLIGILSAVETLAHSQFRPKRTVLLSFGFNEEVGGDQGAAHLSRFLEERYGHNSVALILDEGITQHASNDYKLGWPLGFNEEVGGDQGAAHLSRFLEERYGHNSVALILDEGTPIMSADFPASFGMPLAAVAVTEKGSLNMHLTITSSGGHSSMPPPHTSVGILSKIITTLEENPFQASIEDASSSAVRHFQCIRDATKMPLRLRKALQQLEWAERTTPSHAHLASQLPVLRRWYNFLLSDTLRARRIAKARAQVLAILSPEGRSFFQTTQAADVFHGGIKVNALPERGEAYVNHRIATHSSIKETIEHYVILLKPMADKYRFALTVFGDEVVPKTNTTFAHVSLTDSSFTIDTKPASPFEVPESEAFQLLFSMIRATYYVDEDPRVLRGSLDPDTQEHPQTPKQPVRVASTTLTANTDTAWFHNLTRNIMHFGPQSLHPDLTGLQVLKHLHTINEHATIDALVKGVEFYTHLIVAMDQALIERHA